MVCRCTGAVQDEVVTRPECDSVNSDFKCCNATAPCGLGEGDCDKDADCAGDLVCGTDNCAAGSSRMDCCEGGLRVTHTKFFEADRSLSAFGMRCRPDGNFDFVNEDSNWPVCLEDISCNPPPPAIPTHPEYENLPADDGKVEIQSLVYPALARADMTWNSSQAAAAIPRNYAANLTYTCGTARKFTAPDGTQVLRTL